MCKPTKLTKYVKMALAAALMSLLVYHTSRGAAFILDVAC